jgi:hypothetical protein
MAWLKQMGFRDHSHRILAPATIGVELAPERCKNRQAFALKGCIGRADLLLHQIPARRHVAPRGGIGPLAV